ncbi:MAG: ABC transporter substrate-binding protein [Thermomicrobiales bacterium]
MNIRTGRMNRRSMLKVSAAAAGVLALPRSAGSAQEASPAAAVDRIASATIVPSEEMVDVSAFAKEGPYRIGFSNGFSGNTWRTMTLASIEQEAARHDDLAELIIVDGQGDNTKQVADIESLISQEVDAILTIPNTGSSVVPVLRRAMQEGIIAFPFNLPVDGEEWTAYLGTDPASKGRRLGEWLRDALGGQGGIIALGGLPGNSYTAAAWGQAEAVLTEGGVEVLAFRDAYWEEDRAKIITADLIAAYPQIDGIWADGSQVSAGATKALLDANRPLVPVTGDDYNGLLRLYDEHRESEPGFSFGLLAEPTWESALALRSALQILRGESVPRIQTIEPEFITTENYLDYYRPNLPDGVFVDTDLPDEVLAGLFDA